MLKTTLAITVTYQPDLRQLQQQIERLTGNQVDVIVVDNGSENQTALASLLAQNFPGVRLLTSDENKGIAKAQNLGIQFALEHYYQYILLMDQDSLPAEDMVHQLHKAIKHYPDAAAVGPQFLDAEQKIRSRFIRINGLIVDKNLQPDAYGCVKVDHLIASGSLIPLTAIDRVGMMEEALFIDYVDIEWALRARSKGLESYGVAAAVMHHSLGEGRARLLNRSVALHSPLRHYYQIRNAILLYKRSYIPLNWKIVDAYKLLAKTVVLFFSSQKKALEIKMIAKGIMHGVRNVKGKFY